jgi:hypothetical protein
VGGRAAHEDVLLGDRDRARARVDLVAGSLSVPAGERLRNTAVHVGPGGDVTPPT